jgi:1,4-alpha-glucan branching enzyme
MAKAQAVRKASKTAKKPVSFVVHGVDGKDVAVTGDFIGWSVEGIRLARGSDHDWSTTLMLEPGEYQYRLRVDGEWRDVPETEKRVPNPYGSENGVLTVS